MTQRLRLLSLSMVLVCAGAVTAWGQYPSAIVGFNGGTIDDPTAREMFQIPQWSGTTADFVMVNNPPDAYNFNYAARFSGLQTEGAAAMQVMWYWTDPNDPDAWVRLTTFNGIDYPNPSLNLQGKVRFDFTNRSQLFFGAVGVCLSIRETDVVAAQLANGGTSGDLEWVGVDTSTLTLIKAGPNGVIDSTLGGDDQIIDLNADPNVANEVISWGANGVFESTYNGASDDIAVYGVYATLAGAFVPIPKVILDPSASAYSLEWNLATGVVSVNGTPQGGGIAPFTGNGILSTPNNRGTLDAICFTNYVPNTADQIIVAIDQLQFESPVPDPTPAPSIQSPVFVNNTQVYVDCIAAATSAELFINDISAGTAVPSGEIATFGSLSLNAGDVLTATQTANGLTSPLSLPVVVFAQGVLMADNFDTYATQADLNMFWTDSIANPVPATAKLLLQAGSAASCPNYLREQNPSGANAARLYRSISGSNGTDADPLLFTWNFRYTGAATSAGARTRIELAHFDGSGFSTGARGDGTCGITIYNSIAGDCLTQYNLVLRVSDPNDPLYAELTSNGWVDSGGFLHHASGVTKEADTWYKMQIEVLSNVINYYIDDVLVNPTPYETGVPRPNTTAYDFIIIGEGYSNNGPEMMYDNLSIVKGTTPPFPPPVTAAPTIVEPVYPGVSTVDLADVDPNATDVAVFSNGSPIGSAVGPFAGGTASVSVTPALANGATLTATQTVDGVESCDSTPITVGVPAVTIDETVLVPGQTTVQIANLAAGIASQIRIYTAGTTLIGTLAAPATDPAAVTTSPLIYDAEITATQVVNGVESAPSDPMTVTVPAPTLNATLAPGDTVVPVDDVHPLAATVTVYVNGSPAGSAPGNGTTTVNVTLGSSLFINDQVTARQTIGGTEGPDSNMVEVEVPLCFLVYSDDFDTDTSAGWAVHKRDDASLNDDAATFAFDYGAVGIPPSPNGDGSTFGLKLEANQDATAGVAGITANPIGQSFSAATGYRLTFDMWINANGPFPAGGTGSTEFLTAGVGYDNTTVNVGGGTFTGHGAWYAICGEGGSSADVRAYKDAAAQFPESGQFAAGTTSGIANNTNNSQYYTDLFGNPGPAPPAAQTALYPNQTGNTLVGSAAFAWHQVTITVFGTKARWEIDGAPIVTIDTTVGNPFSGLDGNICVGYMDIFTSISDNPAMSFGLIDNVKIYVAGVGGTNGDYNNDTHVNIVDFVALDDCMGGPDFGPDHSAGAGCASTCRGAFDFDLDDDIDLLDFADFQTLFTGP